MSNENKEKEKVFPWDEFPSFRGGFKLTTYIHIIDKTTKSNRLKNEIKPTLAFVTIHEKSNIPLNYKYIIKLPTTNLSNFVIEINKDIFAKLLEETFTNEIITKEHIKKLENEIFDPRLKECQSKIAQLVIEEKERKSLPPSREEIMFWILSQIKLHKRWDGEIEIL